MWITDEVDLPRELVDAQTAGDELVVFVGAGASMGPPSNLPNFDRLAELVAEELGLASERAESEPAEAFLERLEAQGRPMREQVVNIIRDSGTGHNPLHTAVVQLFDSAADLRIVTTNYDDHLREAAAAHFGDEPKIYGAPALPLGREFTGIVHVHGAQSGRPENLVITSTDFARAYMTDAWATRFLIDLFTTYSTLFVGYSQNDVVMQYLNRGLRPGPPRWGLISSSEDETKWHPLGVIPIVYLHSDDHAALTGGMVEWSRQTRMRLLDHEKQIAEVMAKGQPQNPSQIDYLNRALGDEGQVDYFVNNATDPAWLEWTAHRPPFEALFRPGALLSEASWRLAWWFGERAASDGEQALLSVLKHGGSLHPETAKVVAQNLSKNRPGAIALGRWVAILVQVGDSGVDERLGYILADAQWPGDRDLALHLLDHLIERSIKLAPGFGTVPNRLVRFITTDLRGQQHFLEQAWSGFFLPHLDELAAELVTIFEYQLEKASRLQRMVGAAGEDFDLESFNRTSIDDDPQNGFGSSFDFVIDSLRECMRTMARADPSEFGALIERFGASRSPLLRRFALYGWAIRTDKTDDDRLDHLRTARLIFHFSERREVFRLLERAVPGASTSIGPLISTILQGPQADEVTSEVIDRQRVVDLLAQMAANSEEAQAALTEYLRTHPGFGPSQHLGYDRWIGPSGFGTPRSIPVEQLLRTRTLDELKGLIEEVLGDPEAQPSIFGLPESISAAGAQDPSWTRSMLDQLVAANDWTSPLWNALFWGLSREGVELTEEFLFALCDFLLDVLSAPGERGEGLGDHLKAISQLLMVVTRRPNMTLELLDRLEIVGLRVASLVDSGPIGEIDGRPERVFTDAFNHWTGWITRFFVSATSKRWAADKEAWTVLPERYRHAFQALLAATDGRNVYPESILTGQYHFLAAADETWALEHVRPLFAFEHGLAVPARAWSSFCEGVPLNERVIRHLRADLVPAATNLRGKVGEQFAEKFAEIMVRSPTDFVSDGSLARVIANFDEDMRLTFAHMVEWLLLRSDPAFAADQWPRWISTYVGQRLAATPVLFSGPEAGRMFGWVVAAGEHFPEAVAQYVRANPTFAESRGVWAEISGRRLAEQFPKPTIDLTAFVLARTEQAGFFSCDAVGELFDTVLPTLEAEWVDKLIDICQSAARLRCQDASAWEARLRELAQGL